VRVFLLQALVLTVVALVLASVAFRSVRARKTLDIIRDVALLYVLAILALGLWTYFSRQFF
jgi:heme A synthase